MHPFNSGKSPEMAKISFINPGVNYERNLGFARRFAVKVAPLGIAYLAAILRARGDQVMVIDQFAEGTTDESIVGRLSTFGTDVVGFNLLTASASRTKRICLQIRQSLPAAKIVLGNIHASIFHERILREGWADAIVHGEGEPLIEKIVDAFGGSGDLAEIPSLSFMKNGEVVQTPRAEQLRELDHIPFPAWDLFDLSQYQTHTILTYGKMTLPLISSRGCPWNCLFCSQNHFWKKVVLRDPALVAQEMVENNRRFGCRHMTFHDANFPVSKKYGMELAEAIIQSGLPGKSTFVTEARMEIFDEELILTLKRAGCCALMFGIESGVERIRDTIHKGFSNEKIRRVVEICDREKINTMGLFLIGLPGETKEDFKQTARFARSLPLDLAKFNVVVPYPGSALFNRLAAETNIQEEDFDRIATFYSDGFSAFTVNEHMTTREIDRLQKTALMRFFIRPHVVLRLLFSNVLSLGDMVVGLAALAHSAFARLFGQRKK